MMETIGDRIRKFREAKELSQGKLGALTGLSSKYIGSFEQGRRTPGPRAVKQLCAFLGVDEQTLRYGKAETAAPKQTRQRPAPREERRTNPALRLAYSEVESRLEGRPVAEVFEAIGRMLKAIDDFDKAA